MAPASAPWQRSHLARLCRMTPSGASSEGEQPLRRESSLARRHCRDVAKVARSNHWVKPGQKRLCWLSQKAVWQTVCEVPMDRGPLCVTHTLMTLEIAPHDVTNRVTILFTSVRIEADCMGLP
jgi:hypothetical protein